MRRTARRRWLWLTGAALAAVAIAVATVLTVSRSFPPTEPAEAAPTPAVSATPTVTPSPTTQTCQVTPVAGDWWSPAHSDLPTDGPANTHRVADLDGDSVTATVLDDRLVALLVKRSGEGDASLLVVDRTDGAVRLRMPATTSTTIVASQATSGLVGKMIASTGIGPDFTSSRIDLYDLTSGDVLASRTIDGDGVGGIHTTSGLAGGAWITTENPSAVWVTTRTTATLLDTTTLTTVASVTGQQFGVGQFEGGVPFRLVGGTLFVGGHAVDGRTGTVLGWRADSAPLAAAGFTLSVPLVYDSVDPFPLSGLDTRTGSTCWTRQAASVATDAQELWIVSDTGALQRLDPQTGAVLEDRGQVGNSFVRLLDGILLTTPNYDGSTPPATSVIHRSDGSTVEIPTGGGPLAVSHNQILSRTYGTVDTGAMLTAYDAATGARAWELPLGGYAAQYIAVDSLLALQVTPHGDGSLGLSILN